MNVMLSAATMPELYQKNAYFVTKAGLTTLEWNFATKRDNILISQIRMTSVMKKIQKTFAAIFVLFLLALITNAQTAQRPPRQERLLNGLKVLIWNEPSNDRVMIRLRIHSGSAFDQQGKEGTMKILAESIFPDEQTRTFFTEDLGGQLEVISNYDHIQINASSRADAFLTMIETIASAVATPTIDKSTTDTVKQRVSALWTRRKAAQNI